VSGVPLDLLSHPVGEPKVAEIQYEVLTVHRRIRGHGVFYPCCLRLSAEFVLGEASHDSPVSLIDKVYRCSDIEHRPVEIEENDLPR
jgi:hypothetical protein